MTGIKSKLLFLLALLLLIGSTFCKHSNKDVWYDQLPDCPCSYPDSKEIILEDGWAIDKGDIATYHSGASVCIRSYPYVETSEGKSGQQCCYDENGNLITGGSGAGTPDKVSTCSGETSSGEMRTRIWGLLGHYSKDVIPWEKFGGKDGGWKEYNKFHPPNNGMKCDENLVNWD